jgi:hypothetical protein
MTVLRVMVFGENGHNRSFSATLKIATKRTVEPQ